jgi:hypothetical protein
MIVSNRVLGVSGKRTSLPSPDDALLMIGYEAGGLRSKLSASGLAPCERLRLRVGIRQGKTKFTEVALLLFTILSLAYWFSLIITEATILV